MLVNSLKKVQAFLKINSKLSTIHKDLLYQTRANFLNDMVLHRKEIGISDEKYYPGEIIVSLTTHNRRIYDVYLTIESLMQQTRKANRIVLWISEEHRADMLPMALKSQESRGLEIKYCKDIRSYTKLIPALKAFPNDVIITVDDDIVYDVNMIDRLVMAYLKDSTKIYYNRGHKMMLSPNNKLVNYNDWEWRSPSMDISPLNFPTGVGGVLYPPRCFNEEVFNEEVFLGICKSADDVWFKAMAIYNGILSQKVYTSDNNGEDYLENINVQDIGLRNVNTHLGENDKQIQAVFNKYNLYDILKKNDIDKRMHYE